VFHPVTTEYDNLAQEAMELLVALDELGENVFWVWPNADAGSRKIIKAADRYLADSGSRRFEFFDHVPMALFVSLMAHAKLMVGNSSAGIREAGYFGVPVVDVGTRQQNRERGANVRTVPTVECACLIDAMRAQLRHGRFRPEQLYGSGDSGRRIAGALASTPLPPLQKRFHEPLSIDFGSAGAATSNR
jgi:UDP-N-acetylglucosamine 2-epimerase